MLRILLIDDNPHDRILAIRSLEREFPSLQVKEIAKLEELDQVLETDKFDLTITDYQLRWSDGLAVLRTIKARYPECPVIMFTNSGTQEIAVEAMKSGLDDYVIKSPKHYIRLAAAVRSAWEKAEIHRKATSLENRLQSLLNQLNVGVFRLTESGSLLEANPAFFRLLGLSELPSSEAAQSLKSYFHPEDYTQLLNQLKENEQIRDRVNAATPLAPGEELALLSSAEREVQLRRADGSTIWVRLSKTISTIDGKTIIEGLMEDISDRKQLESALRKQAEDLERANRIKDEFLAVLSHELRSPLNAILGWTQLLRNRKLDETATSRALETIDRNARLQTQLIEDLLDISRIMRGKLSLHISLVDLVSTIEVTIDTMRLAAQAKSIQIQFTSDPSIGLLEGDHNRLQQVIWNLLSNAIKFTPAGGRVAIILERNGTQAQLQVSDTGKGISPEFLPHVFDYFRQADSSTTRMHGGLGLGLAIVRNLVELHGGTVSASSPGVGQGATFTVTLPLKIDPTLENSEQVLSSVKSAPTFNNSSILNGKRVLVVDDEVDTRDFYATVLKDFGASVTAVASVREALEALRRQRPDVLLSDIGMPIEDGYALIRQVRAWESEQGGRLPAVALTAYAREIDREEALAAGFQKHLPKPVEPEELVAVVAHLAGQSEVKESQLDF